MTFFEKLTLLKQLQLTKIEQPITKEHFSSTDLFGDEHSFDIKIQEKELTFSWLINSKESQSIKLELSESGRAKIVESKGFNPAIKTVSQAVDAAIETLKKMPKKNNSNSFKIK